MSASLVTQRPKVTGSTTGWLNPGDYGYLACGCHLMSFEFDPCGPRLLYVENMRYPCRLTHTSTEWTDRVRV